MAAAPAFDSSAWSDPASLREDTDARVVNADPWWMNEVVLWLGQTQRKMDGLSGFLLYPLFHGAAELSL